MNPFIPIGKANVVIVDGRLDISSIDFLRKLNLKVIPTIKCEDIEESISYHPDIVIHPINHNTLIIAPNVYDYYEDKLKGMDIKLIKGDTYLASKYPFDIAYNVGRLKHIAIHNFKYTDEKLKFYLKKENLQLINVNQGYTKCSIAIIDEDKGITADYGMFTKLSNLGYEILLIEPGYITLEKQKYGFIGGATGNYSPDTIFISGNLDSHPSKDKILNFIKNAKKKIKYLSNNQIVDIGTIISLKCN